MIAYVNVTAFDNGTSTSAMYFKKHATIFDKRRVNQHNVTPANGRSYMKHVTPKAEDKVPPMGLLSPVHKHCRRVPLVMSYPALLLPPLVPVSVQPGNYRYVG
jgi:hypothetical protein